MRSCPGCSCEGVGNAFAGSVGGVLRDPGELLVDRAAIPGGQYGAEQSDTECGTELSRHVVQRGRDALALPRQRAGDRLGGRRHRQAHAESHREHAGQDREIAAVNGDERGHQDQPGGTQQDSGGHRRATADPRGNAWGEARGEHHQQCHRHQREGGTESGPAEDGLEVREQHDEDAGLHTEDRQERQRTAGEPALAKQPNVEERGLLAQFPRHEADRTDDTSGQAQQGQGRDPTSVRTLVESEDEPEDSHHGSQRADSVEPVLRRLTRVGDGPQRHHSSHDDEYDGQDEEPPPARQIDQYGGQVHTQDAATTGDRGPHPDRLRTVIVREGRGDDSQRDRHDHRRADTAEEPCREHHFGRRGQACRRTGRSEQEQTGQQHRLAAPPIPQGAEWKEQRGQADRVDVDEPQDLGLRGAECDRKVRLRDVQPRHRSNDRHQGDADRNQDRPPPTRIFDHRLRVRQLWRWFRTQGVPFQMAGRMDAGRMATALDGLGSG